MMRERERTGGRGRERRGGKKIDTKGKRHNWENALVGQVNFSI
jgi:hypothetical protein